jgi:hypothetical protein
VPNLVCLMIIASWIQCAYHAFSDGTVQPCDLEPRTFWSRLGSNCEPQIMSCNWQGKQWTSNQGHICMVASCSSHGHLVQARCHLAWTR